MVGPNKHPRNNLVWASRKLEVAHSNEGFLGAYLVSMNDSELKVHNSFTVINQFDEKKHKHAGASIYPNAGRYCLSCMRWLAFVPTLWEVGILRLGSDGDHQRSQWWISVGRRLCLTASNENSAP